MTSYAAINLQCATRKLQKFIASHEGWMGCYLATSINENEQRILPEDGFIIVKIKPEAESNVEQCLIDFMKDTPIIVMREREETHRHRLAKTGRTLSDVNPQFLFHGHQEYPNVNRPLEEYKAQLAQQPIYV